MAEQANITSLEALEAFRANLILFIAKAHRSVDEVGDEVRRTRSWLQHDQRLYWENQARQRQRKLDLANQELLSARLTEARNSTTLQENAVRKWKLALAEAEEKLRKVKIWNRDFGSQADPLMRKVESLRHFLDFDMPKAISYLLQAQMTLESYTELRPNEAPAAPPSGSGDAAPAPAASETALS
jgi:hypothetical protein